MRVINFGNSSASFIAPDIGSSSVLFSISPGLKYYLYDPVKERTTDTCLSEISCIDEIDKIQMNGNIFFLGKMDGRESKDLYSFDPKTKKTERLFDNIIKFSLSQKYMVMERYNNQSKTSNLLVVNYKKGLLWKKEYTDGSPNDFLFLHSGDKIAILKGEGEFAEIIDIPAKPDKTLLKQSKSAIK